MSLCILYQPKPVNEKPDMEANSRIPYYGLTADNSFVDQENLAG